MDRSLAAGLSPPVETDAQIALVAALAEEIWQEHFTAIIGEAQVRYMLDRFQSRAAIARHIATGAAYAFIMTGDEPIGYTAVVPDKTNRTLQVSKLYVKRTHRGKGAGRAALDEIIRSAETQDLTTIWLTVNRHNRDALLAYEKWGFENQGVMVTDIGNGFKMDDYKLVLSIERC